MAYEHLSRFYDKFTEDIPYDKYINLLKKYISSEDSILDLGCGTGNILYQLWKSGFYVEGLDISEEMLLIARQKIPSAFLYLEDMRTFNVKNKYDLVYSFIDSLNYLKTKKAVKKTFLNVFRALKSSGYFIFDIYNFSYAKEKFREYSFHELKEDYVFIWDTFVENYLSGIKIYHNLVFFLREEENRYRKHEEYQEQVSYPADIYISLLEDVGFEIREIYYDFKKNKKNTAYKIIVVAKKCVT